MRSAGARLGRKRSLQPIAAPNQQIAITYARYEFNGARVFGLLSDLLLRRTEQYGRLLGGNVIGGEIPHRLVFDGDEIASDRPVIGAQRNSSRGRFHRRSPSEVGKWIVSHQAQVPDLRSSRESVGGVAGRGYDSGGRHRIHMRRAGGLQGRLAAQLFLRLVRRPIWDDDGILHVSL